jgi:hypothetical protein
MASKFLVRIPAELVGGVLSMLSAEEASCAVPGMMGGPTTFRFSVKEDAETLTWLIREEFQRLLNVVEIKE